MNDNERGKEINKEQNDEIKPNNKINKKESNIYNLIGTTNELCKTLITNFNSKNMPHETDLNENSNSHEQILFSMELIRISNVLRELKKEDIKSDLIGTYNELLNLNENSINELSNLYESLAPNPFSDTYVQDLQKVSYHIHNLITSKDEKLLFYKFTYKYLKQQLDNIIKCDYWQTKSINLNNINPYKYIYKMQA